MEREPREGRDESPIRGMINKINQHHPSQEKSREVLVSEDGTKLTKVIKKRRVVLSEKDKRRGLYMRYMIAAGSALALLLLAFIYYLVQWTQLTGEHYLIEKKEELRQGLRAELLAWQGASINSFCLSAAKLTLTFPQDSVIDYVEMAGLEGSFSAGSVWGAKLRFPELRVESATVVLRAGMDHMQLPDIDLDALCEVERMSCKSFNVRVAGEQSPFQLSQAQAYLCRTDGDSPRWQISLSSGTLSFEDWTSFDVEDLRAAFTPTHCELRAQLIQQSTQTLQGQVGGGKVELYQSIAEGQSFYGPYQFLSQGLDFSFLTDSRLKGFFTAQTQALAGQQVRESKSRITFSPEGNTPSVMADLALCKVEWRAFPALAEIQRHLESDKRDYYKKPYIAGALVRLESRPDFIHLSIREGAMMEPHQLSIAGDIQLDASNTLSGYINYALPIELCRIEYPDKIPDPIFTTRGEQACLQTTIKGFAFVPDDNSRELSSKAESARQERPEPNNLDYERIESMYQREVPREEAKSLDDLIAP